MRFLNAITFSAVVFSMLFLFSDHALAQRNTQISSRTGYYPYMIARPEDRVWIRNLPIEQRPHRPMHFYGNRVRQTNIVGPATRKYTVGPATRKYTVGPNNRNLVTSRPVRSRGPLLDQLRR